jgi:ribosomal-protein-alanine N-acetyltransferase
MIIRIEPLETGHLSQVVAIENRVNQAPWSEAAFQNEIDNPQSYFVVALGDGKVVGYGGFWRCIDEAHIINIAVSEEARRQGIGRKIMTHLLETAKEEGLWCSTLEVRASNEPAIKLYNSFGFKETARRKGYYPDREDAIVMWLYDLNG